MLRVWVDQLCQKLRRSVPNQPNLFVRQPAVAPFDLIPTPTTTSASLNSFKMFMTLLSLFSEPASRDDGAEDHTVSNVQEESLLRECGICFDMMRDTQTHECCACEYTFCVNCMRTYIESKVQDGLVSTQHLICPASTCAHALSNEQIEAFTDSSTFQKYTTFFKNQTIGIRYCPRVGCSTALEEPLHSHHRRVMCSACQQESCMRCGRAFHKIPICRSMEKELRKWRKQQRKNARSCPNCMVVIEKNGGCQHMTCTHCRHQFCWICMRPWETHGSVRCRWRVHIQDTSRADSVHSAPVQGMISAAKFSWVAILVIVGGVVEIAFTIVDTSATIVLFAIGGAVLIVFGAPYVVYQLFKRRHKNRV